MSEFEESYASEASDRSSETFNADLLEEMVDVLQPPVPSCVDVGERLDCVLAGMAERNQGCVLVTKDEKLVGIFTERDLLRRVVGKVDPRSTAVGGVMTPEPEAITFHDSIAAALNKMTVGGFRHVPLVDIQHRPVGVLSVKDVVDFFVSHFPRRILNVAPDPTRKNPNEPSGAG